MKTKLLYRPVGLKELELIAQSDFCEFPPRLSWQPIFYPVLNEKYAIQIAQDWNKRDEFSGYAGFVTRFKLPLEYLKNYEIQNVGGFEHNELWIPSEDLELFNSKIIGKIELIKSFLGKNFLYPENADLAKKIDDVI